MTNKQYKIFVIFHIFHNIMLGGDYWRKAGIFVTCFFFQCFNVLYTLRMDENNDGTLTEEEFLKGCLQDDELSKMLAPNVSG